MSLGKNSLAFSRYFQQLQWNSKEPELYPVDERPDKSTEHSCSWWSISSKASNLDGPFSMSGAHFSTLRSFNMRKSLSASFHDIFPSRNHFPILTNLANLTSLTTLRPFCLLKIFNKSAILRESRTTRKKITNDAFSAKMLNEGCNRDKFAN